MIISIHQKHFRKWLVGGTPHPTLLNPPLAISYRNHQKSLAYFNHLAQLILLFLLKDKCERGGGGGHGRMPPLNTLLATRMVWYQYWTTGT